MDTSQLVHSLAAKLEIAFGSCIPVDFLFYHPSADPTTNSTGHHKHNYHHNKPKSRASKAT